MRTLALSSFLLLCAFTTFAQDQSELFDKAPPAIDEALRARVMKFYEAFMAGKFKDAYALVADDSQDKFFELSKDQYKSCEIIKIHYTENFTKATAVTSCKSDWHWHGVVTPTTFPLTSNWEVIDGQWYWHFVKPTMVPSPFSPNGFVTVPPDSNTSNAGLVPNDMNSAAQGILSRVGIDKAAVRLSSVEHSTDMVHVRNDMPGEVRLKLDKLDVPGLSVTVGKTSLEAHEQTTLLFDWNSSNPKPVNAPLTVRLRIEPTAQVFTIKVLFDSPLPAASSVQK